MNKNFDVFYAKLDLMTSIGNALLDGADAMVELERVKKERDEWRKKYSDSLDEDIKHGQKMVANTLTALLNKANEK